MNRYTLPGLSAAGGLLCGLAWTGWCTGLVLLAALVPFLLIGVWLRENPARYHQNSYFIYILPGFIIFSMLAIGWMRSASLTGAIMVVCGLAVIMSSMLWISHIISIKAGWLAGSIAFITLWMVYELLSLNLIIVSPWLNLGNGLAKDIRFIQWYEYTGTAGGTLWILLSNLLMATFIVRKLEGSPDAKNWIAAWLLVVITPAALSFYMFFSVREAAAKPVEVVIVQPDVDPFTQKFTVPFDEQLGNAIRIARGGISEKTAWIIFPETTVDDPVDLDSTKNNKYLNMLRDLLRESPDANIVAGLVSRKVYRARTETPSESARKTGGPGEYTDDYNSAFRIDTGSGFEVYHKSKLVPGIEMQFLNGPGKLIGRILPYLGGSKWGYGIQEERTCFTHSGSLQKAGPVICYESVFGSFVTGYVRNKAEMLFIITNDGWWKNTNGYKQHLWYASLRAIENRRPVARSANTGISCLVNIRGERINETEWWKPAVVKGKLIPETRITFYTRHGDYLLWIAAILALVTVLYTFVVLPVKKFLNNR